MQRNGLWKVPCGGVNEVWDGFNAEKRFNYTRTDRRMGSRKGSRKSGLVNSSKTVSTYAEGRTGKGGSNTETSSPPHEGGCGKAAPEDERTWLMNPTLSQDERYEMMRDMAFIAVVCATGKRCDDLTNLLISQMVRFPDGKGIMFGFQFGKTLRDGSRHMFGLRQDDITPEICTVRLMDDLDEFASKVRIRKEGNSFLRK